MKKQQRERLEYWQEKLGRAETYWSPEKEKMDERERQFAGNPSIRPLVQKDDVTETKHVYNIISETIEAIVDSNIPMPKVTPRRKKDERLARIIEHMIRNELERMHAEEINDMQERTCPKQGATFYHVEWDEGEVSSDHKGEVSISAIHPKMVLPQPGVFSSIDDMDWIGLLVPDTKEHVKRVFGIDVREESETDPDIRSVGTKDTEGSEDLVTRKIVYYRNGDSIGKFHFVGDSVLEDLDDCQCRRKRRCATCGALENTESLILSRATQDGTYPQGAETGSKAEKGVCPYCGGTKWEDSNEDYMEILVPTEIAGEMVGGTEAKLDNYGNLVQMATEHIPYYKPRVFPLVMQRNVSKFGQLLGESDVDKISDQQNTMNRLSQKIINRLMEAGTAVTLPPDTKLVVDPKDNKTWRLQSPSDREYIGVYDFTGNLQYEMMYLNQVYQEARNLIGVTDSFQGRTDATATSGKAKEFAAQQSAGRMESKRVMKNAAYERLFELIFKFRLAYSDEPRAVHYKDEHGMTQYEEFNPMDFLERGADGEWKWNTDFLFGVDDTGGMAGNRSVMWRELTTQLQSGAMGDPSNPETLIDYWAAMEELHYPMAGQIRSMLVRRQESMMQAQVQANAALAGNIPMETGQEGAEGMLPENAG